MLLLPSRVRRTPRLEHGDAHVEYSSTCYHPTRIPNVCVAKYEATSRAPGDLNDTPGVVVRNFGEEGPSSVQYSAPPEGEQSGGTRDRGTAGTRTHPQHAHGGCRGGGGGDDYDDGCPRMKKYASDGGDAYGTAYHVNRT